MIAEGCYPYIAGGVSAWIQMLVEAMPQHEFVIFTIGAEQALKGKYQYDIPKNVVEIRENFLDCCNQRKSLGKKQYQLSYEQKKNIVNLLEGKDVHWEVIFDMFGKTGKINGNRFLESKAYLNIIQSICARKYKQQPFNDVFWTMRSMLISLLSLIQCEVPQADIYHSVSTGYAGIMGAMFKHYTHKPLIITEHGIYTREREEEILKSSWVDNSFKSTWIDFFMNISLGAYKSADAITSLFGLARQMQIDLGADQDKCSIIPNGIDTNRFAQIPPISERLNGLTIGAIVRVVPIKDIKTMIYSFELVKKEIDNAKLYIIGPLDENPQYYKECLELIEVIGCKDIEFVGRVDIGEWMERLDMVLLTSVSEGQPFVLLEAMAAKRPVVATDVGSCREIIEGNNDGLGAAGRVAAVMNPNAIAKCILKLARDREVMAHMGEVGYKRVCQYYKKEDFLVQYEQLYRRLMQ